MTDKELAAALRRSGSRLIHYHNQLESKDDRDEAMHLAKLIIEACQRLEARQEEQG
jgi:predicted GTPase